MFSLQGDFTGILQIFAACLQVENYQIFQICHKFNYGKTRLMYISNRPTYCKCSSKRSCHCRREVRRGLTHLKPKFFFEMLTHLQAIWTPRVRMADTRWQMVRVYPGTIPAQYSTVPDCTTSRQCNAQCCLCISILLLRLMCFIDLNDTYKASSKSLERKSQEISSCL